MAKVEKSLECGLFHGVFVGGFAALSLWAGRRIGYCSQYPYSSALWTGGAAFAGEAIAHYFLKKKNKAHRQWVINLSTFTLAVLANQTLVNRKFTLIESASLPAIALVEFFLFAVWVNNRDKKP